MNIPLKKLKKEQLKDFTKEDLTDLATYLNEDLREVQNQYRACSERDVDKHEVYERKIKKIKDKIDLVWDLVAEKLVNRYL